MNVVIGNKTYTYIQICSLYWLQQNLDFSYLTESNEYYYYNNRDSHKSFGYLYNWDVATNISSYIASNIPQGWRLPTKLEWESLINTYGGKKEAGPSLRAISSLWTLNVGAINDSLMYVLPGGYREPETNDLKEIGYTARFWTNTSYNTDNAWCMEVLGEDTEANLIKLDKTINCSIRLVKTV